MYNISAGLNVAVSSLLAIPLWKIMLEKTDHQVVESSEECPYVELMVNSSSSCVCRPASGENKKKE